MSGWRHSPVVALALISIFAFIQLAIPISHIGGPQATDRFAWQMFSTYAPDPGFTVVTESAETAVDLRDHMARARSDIAIVDVVPEYLCQTVPNAVRVEWNGGILGC